MKTLLPLQKNKPYFIVIFIQFVYAGMALMSKAAIAKGMNPDVFVVYRQALATVTLAPFAFFDRKHAAPLSCNLICKIFLIALCGLTVSSNLYFVAINYTSATYAAATTNTIPAITFIMAVILRMEIISIKQMHGLAKLLGSILSLSGAIVYALVRGPPLDFTKWRPENHKQVSHSLTAVHTKGESIRGSLLMLLANISGALWLVMQSAVLAVAVERNPSAWKLGWDVNLLSVAYCGIIATGISYWLQVCTIEEKGPVFAAVFTPLALIITAIFSALVWKETLYWGSIGGALLLVVGLYSVLWGKKIESEEGKENEEIQEIKEETRLECI